MSGSPIVTDANDFDFAICDELGPGGAGRSLQHDARRCRRPGDLLDTAAPGREPRHPRGRHVPLQRPVGRRRAAPERRHRVPAGLPRRAGCSPGPVRSATSRTSAASGWARSRRPRRTSSPRRCRRRRSRWCATSSCRTTSPTRGYDGRGCRCWSASTCARRSARTSVGRKRLLEVIEQYGADTVKAVMKRMMADAESRLRAQADRAARRHLARHRVPGPVARGRPRHPQDHRRDDQDRGPPDLRLPRHRPAGRRHQLHLRRACAAA